MISGSSHLACPIVDGIVRGLLVLNLGSNLVLVLVLGLRLYSTQNTQGTKSTRCNAQNYRMHDWCTKEALQMHLGSTESQHRKHRDTAQGTWQHATSKKLQNMLTRGYYESTCKNTQVTYRTCSKRSNGLKVTPETINMHKLKLTAT